MPTTESSRRKTTDGSAAKWGPLWGARPRDWALSEDQQRPTYEEAIRRVGLRAGERVLDVGCGAGAFLRLLVERGAVAFGIDASEALVAIARERVPGAEVRVGEMEEMPYAEDSFELVTGFNSFFFATDMTAALREAGRVAKPGAPVVIQVWGAHERCQLEAMKEVIRPFLPPRPPGAPPEPELWRPGELEALASAAGLTPESAFGLSWAYEFADAETLRRAMLAPAGIAALVGPEREAELGAALLAALAPYGDDRGGYRLENEFRFLIARAP